MNLGRGLGRGGGSMGRVVRVFVRLTSIGTGLVALALGVTVALTDPAPKTLPERALRWLSTRPRPGRSSHPTTAARAASDVTIPLYSDNWIDDSGYTLAIQFSKPADDPASLAQVR